MTCLYDSKMSFILQKAQSERYPDDIFEAQKEQARIYTMQHHPVAESALVQYYTELYLWLSIWPNNHDEFPGRKPVISYSKATEQANKPEPPAREGSEERKLAQDEFGNVGRRPAYQEKHMRKGRRFKSQHMAHEPRMKEVTSLDSLVKRRRQQSRQSRKGGERGQRSRVDRKNGIPKPAQPTWKPTFDVKNPIPVVLPLREDGYPLFSFHVTHLDDDIGMGSVWSRFRHHIKGASEDFGVGFNYRRRCKRADGTMHSMYWVEPFEADYDAIADKDLDLGVKVATRRKLVRAAIALMAWTSQLVAVEFDEFLKSWKQAENNDSVDESPANLVFLSAGPTVYPEQQGLPRRDMSQGMAAEYDGLMDLDED